jgi:hypothetical protein
LGDNGGMDWQTENRIIELERLLEQACDLLSVYGAVDPVTEEDHEPVRAFLQSDRLRAAQT